MDLVPSDEDHKFIQTFSNNPRLFCYLKRVIFPERVISLPKTCTYIRPTWEKEAISVFGQIL